MSPGLLASDSAILACTQGGFGIRYCHRSLHTRWIRDLRSILILTADLAGGLLGVCPPFTLDAEGRVLAGYGEIS